MPFLSTRRQLRPSAGGESGAALVEFALVLPLLLVLLLGVVDFGKAFNYWIDQTHLANEAARFAAVNKSPVAGQDIEQAIKNQANTNELKSGGGSVASPGVVVTVCFPTGSTGRIGQPVEVRVRATYKWLQYLVGKVGLVDTPITGKAVMRLESAYKNDAAADAYTATACT